MTTQIVILNKGPRAVRIKKVSTRLRRTDGTDYELSPYVDVKPGEFADGLSYLTDEQKITVEELP